MQRLIKYFFINRFFNKIVYPVFIVFVFQFVGEIIGKGYFVKNYKDVSEEDLNKASKVILSGTSLADFEYLKNLDKFSWLGSFKAPVLGICAGMQIIGLIFGGKLLDENYIGKRNGKYYLHKKSVSLPPDFKKTGEDSFRHKTREIYGVLFHPEVYNEEVIKNFIHQNP